MRKAAKLVFMGTPLFAVPSLEALIKAGYEVSAVVTRQDKPRGRGLVVVESPVKEAALRNNIAVIEPLSMRDEAFKEALLSISPDIIAVVAYGKILPPSILELPPKGCINLHASLLPKYRGAAPINWAIINGEKTTGVSTMLMDKGMDTGPILLKEETAIGEDETAEGLGKRLSEIGSSLLAETINRVLERSVTPAPQDERDATWAPILKKGDGRIDWKKDARLVKCLIRGVVPWPGAHTLWRDSLLKIHSGLVIDADTGEAPGTITGLSRDGIEAACGKGTFVITGLQPENRKKITAAEFIQGYRIIKGERFC
ncbi:MAG: methionyl-tRNA formyltransferase [Deltaproteobacteria bacterium]|nr:methionyl-tRNA formyltransferase [Deltaproteobacteria bacterium]